MVVLHSIACHLCIIIIIFFSLFIQVLYDIMIWNIFIFYVACLLCQQLGFMLLALIWKFDFPPFMVLIIAILNDGLFFSFLLTTISISYTMCLAPEWIYTLDLRKKYCKLPINDFSSLRCVKLAILFKAIDISYYSFWLEYEFRKR